MLSRVATASLTGLSSTRIEVEVGLERGRPTFIIIGLPSKTIDEAKERITAAISQCGFRIKSRKTVVNLAPADVKKTGSAADLAIAIGLLSAYQEVSCELSDVLFLGELSLDGTVRSIRGVLPLVLAAKEMGFSSVVFPQANWPEVSVVTGIKLCPVSSLQELLSQLRKTGKPHQVTARNYLSNQASTSAIICPDLSEIVGQGQAKRAVEIAVAGGHSLLMVGPPGAGKSLLAKAMLGLLPSLPLSQAIDVTQIYSVYNGASSGLITNSPFRSPHHSISRSGLIGGGRNLSPGEVSLAHHGILFLDEFPEFSRDCLEALRQPMQDGQISLVRAAGNVTYPAQFSLVAAANPCPCGHRGQAEKICRCGPHALENYAKKFSGPVLDRIDLMVWVKAVPINQLSRSDGLKAESSLSIKKRIEGARLRQKQRYCQLDIVNNARLETNQIKYLIKLSAPAINLLESAGAKLSLSARTYYKTILVARTIADLDFSEKIRQKHVAEALQFRQIGLF